MSGKKKKQPTRLEVNVFIKYITFFVLYNTSQLQKCTHTRTHTHTSEQLVTLEKRFTPKKKKNHSLSLSANKQQHEGLLDRGRAVSRSERDGNDGDDAFLGDFGAQSEHRMAAETRERSEVG